MQCCGRGYAIIVFWAIDDAEMDIRMVSEIICGRAVFREKGHMSENFINNQINHYRALYWFLSFKAPICYSTLKGYSI